MALKTLRDPPVNGREILRVARSDDGGLCVVLDLEPMPGDPGTWGIILADVVQNLVVAMMDSGLSDDEEGRISKQDIQSRILEMFEAEVASPTDKVFQRKLYKQ